MKVDRLFQVLVVGGALLTTGGCASTPTPTPTPTESAPAEAPAEAPDKEDAEADAPEATPEAAPSSAPSEDAPKKSEGEGGDGDGVCSWL